jgi:PAS domain-containing protein
MISRDILFLLPYLAGCALSLGIAGYVRKYRQVEAARYFSYKALVESIIIAGFILEAVSRTLEEKILWDNVQYVLDLALPGLGYLFVLAIVKRDIRARAGLLVVAVPSAVCAALMATDSLHHLIRPVSSLSSSTPFPELQYPITTVQYALLSYVLLFMVANIVILLVFALRSRGILRPQAFAVSFALLIPLTGASLTLFGIEVGPYRDMTPLTFTLQDIVILVALARFALFDLVPIARDFAIEHMDVALFVEDARRRIVDVNHAGGMAIGLFPREIIGRDTKDVFPHHARELEELRHV